MALALGRAVATGALFVGGIALVAVSAFKFSSDDIFMIDGVPLESMCLSDDQQYQSRCVDHIQALLDDDLNRRTESGRNPFVICYFGELLTLRNVGLRGYREILETIEWLDTIDGKAQTAAYPEFSDISREFATRIEPARDAIRKARETDKMHWPCRLNPFMWRHREQ